MREAARTRGQWSGAIGHYLRDVAAIPLLTLDETVRLGRRAKAGDRQAIRELVRHNLRLVISVAKHYATFGVPMEDLINEGNLGLIRAAERFDVDRGYRFSTYAKWWVREAILRHLTDHGRTVRLPSSQAWKKHRVMRAASQLSHTLGRTPTPGEIGRRLRMKRNAVEKVFNLPLKYVSIDPPAHGTETEFYLHTPADEAAGPDERVLEVTRAEDIEEALATLDARQADVLRRYYGLKGHVPQTLREIGRVYGVTSEWVRQIRNAAIERLRKSPNGRRLADYSA